MHFRTDMTMHCYLFIVAKEKGNLECMSLFALLGSGESDLMYALLKARVLQVPVILSASRNYSYSRQTCSLHGIDLRSVTFEYVLVGIADVLYQWNISE